MLFKKKKSCILHITKVCMKSLFIVIQESNIVIPYQVSMVHMFYLWHIYGIFLALLAVLERIQQVLVSRALWAWATCVNTRGLTLDGIS